MSCSDRPSAASIETELQKHPEILYRVIERHPAEFIAALNKAAQVAQSESQLNAERDAAAKMEEEFQHPKVPVIARRAVLGNPAAPITIVEYSDFECPYCRREREVLIEVMKRYGDRVRLLVKQTPLEMHPHALPAALMYEAVARQDPNKAYKLYDELFRQQERLENEGGAFLAEAVRSVGADLARAEKDAQSDEIRAVIQADLDESRRFGFTGTPAFLINGVSLEGSHSLESFARIIDRHLAGLTSAGSQAPVAPHVPAR